MTEPRQQHTPGPWTAAPLAGGDYLVYQDVPPEAGENVAVVYVGMEVEANARLMAAAWLLPELREALRDLHGVMAYYHKAAIPENADHEDVCENPGCCGHCQTRIASGDLLAQLDKALGS